MATREHAFIFPRPSVVPTPSCPACSLRLPFPRPVLAGRVRCPSRGCGARLRIRGGRALAA